MTRIRPKEDYFASIDLEAPLVASLEVLRIKTMMIPKAVLHQDWQDHVSDYPKLYSNVSFQYVLHPRHKPQKQNLFSERQSEDAKKDVLHLTFRWDFCLIWLLIQKISLLNTFYVAMQPPLSCFLFSYLWSLNYFASFVLMTETQPRIPRVYVPKKERVLSDQRLHVIVKNGVIDERSYCRIEGVEGFHSSPEFMSVRRRLLFQWQGCKGSWLFRFNHYKQFSQTFERTFNTILFLLFY